MNDSRGRRVIAAIGRLLLPPRCLLCGSAGDDGLDLCRECRPALPLQGPSCSACALPLQDGSPLCGRCLKRRPGFDAAWASFTYGGALERLLPRLKFHADLAAGAMLASLMASNPPSFSADVLVPVPLHRKRLAERGYNQALELARPLARSVGLPVRPALLQRVRATTAQTGLSGAERRRNLRDAFATRGKVPARVLLVDDVMTTGTTLTACAEALKRDGAQWVGCWVAARVPDPR